MCVSNAAGVEALGIHASKSNVRKFSARKHVTNAQHPASDLIEDCPYLD